MNTAKDVLKKLKEFREIGVPNDGKASDIQKVCADYMGTGYKLGIDTAIRLLRSYIKMEKESRARHRARP